MTQHYVGTKIVEAWRQASDGVEGYAVKYADGYVSWSPKETFESAYIALGHIGDLPAHVQRMCAESAELNDRLAKLYGFMDTLLFRELPVGDRDLLNEQADAMAAYSDALMARIKRAGA